MKNIPFSLEIRNLAIQDYLNGMSYREVAKKYNTDHKTIMRWLRVAKIKGRNKTDAYKLVSKKLKGIRRSPKTEFKKGIKVWNKGIKWLEMTGKNHPGFGKVAYWAKGSKNINWKGGITKLVDKIRHSLKYKAWRLEVFKKDRYTCQICKQVGKDLQAHHKIEFSDILVLYMIKTLKDALKCKLLFDISWGITLCKKCHKGLHPHMGI